MARSWQRCFYEPSTRTRLSFEAAMLRIGRAACLAFHRRTASFSASKGESVADTVTHRGMLCGHHRHASPQGGRAHRWWPQVKPAVPIINAGDGGHNHPTQTLADLLTIRREKGRLQPAGHRPVAATFKFGRTVHSAHQRHDALREHSLCAHLSGGAARARTMCAKGMHKNGVSFVEVETGWRMRSCTNSTFST